MSNAVEGRTLSPFMSPTKQLHNDDMNDAITVYEKRSCTTCRRLVELLEARGVDFARVEYHVEGLPEGRLRELLRQAGLRPRDVLRVREPLVATLGLDEREVSDDELLRLMAEHPELVQRPIVQRGDRAVLARPPERVLDLL